MADEKPALPAPTGPPPPSLVDRRRRAPRPMTRLEKVGWIASFTLVLVLAVTLLIPGGDGGGYLWVLFLSGILQFWQHNWGTVVLTFIGIIAGVIVRGPTIAIPLAGDGRAKVVWYWPGSLQIEGDRATWREVGSGPATCNAAFLRKTGVLGGYTMVQSVERHTGPDGTTYESQSVEALRSQVLQNRVRLLMEELSSRDLQRREPRGPA